MTDTMSRLVAILERPLWAVRLWRAHRAAERRAAQQLAIDVARNRQSQAWVGLPEIRNLGALPRAGDA